EADRILLDMRVGVLAGNDGNAAGRAHRLAEHAPHAARGPVFPDGQPVAAPESGRERPRLFGVLKRDGSTEVVEQSQAVRGMEKKVAHQMRCGDLEAADDLREVKLFPDSQLTAAQHLDGHRM